ncbi:hypothetical protein Esti_003524 [Eimeria stiedai]
MTSSTLVDGHYSVHSLNSASVGLDTPSTPWVAYLLLACYWRLSRASFVRDARRILASNFPEDEDGGGCSDSSGKDDDDDTPADQTGTPAEGLPLPPMPEVVEQIMARALFLLVEPINRLRLMAPHVPQRFRPWLLHDLASIAALELSGFALLPPTLQPLRAWVARRYLEAGRDFAGVNPCIDGPMKLTRLLAFVDMLGKPPPPTLGASPRLHARIMIMQLRLFELTNFNVLNVLNDLLLSISPLTGSVPEVHVRHAMRVLKELFRARRWQVLRHYITRIWTSTLQREAGKNILFDAQMFGSSRGEPLGTIFKEFQIISEAVIIAGGIPLTPFPIDHDSNEWFDSAVTKAGFNDGQQAIGAYGLHTGDQGLPGSFPQEAPQDKTGGAAPFVFTAHRPTLSSTIYSYPGRAQYSPDGHTPGTSANYDLESLSVVEGDGYQQAGPGGAVPYVKTTIEGDGMTQLPETSGVGVADEKSSSFPPWLEPSEGMMNATPHVSAGTHQSTPSSLQIPSGFEQHYPGGNPLEASAVHGPWGLVEGEDEGHQQEGSHDESFDLGATGEGGAMQPGPGTTAFEMRAQSFAELDSEEELHGAVGGVMPFGAGAHHTDATSSSQAPPGFMQESPDGSANGTLFAGPYGCMGGAEDGQQPAGHGNIIHGLGTTDSSGDQGASAIASESGAVGGQQTQNEDLEGTDDILGLIADALDWKSALDEESQSHLHSVPQQKPQGGVAGDAQQTGHGGGPHGVGAAGYSQLAQTSSAEGTSASTSEGGAPGGQPTQVDDDLAVADELLKLIEATVDWSTPFDEKGGE